MIEVTLKRDGQCVAGLSFPAEAVLVIETDTLCAALYSRTSQANLEALCTQLRGVVDGSLDTIDAGRLATMRDIVRTWNATHHTANEFSLESLLAVVEAFDQLAALLAQTAEAQL